MYKIDLIVDPPFNDNWGEFAVRKTYRVSAGGTPKGVFGYVIQKVEKVTRFEAAGRTYTTSAEVSEFTSNNVNYATESYYEVFPILNGTTCLGRPMRDRGNCIDDQFQNGALLRYEEDDGEQIPDDEPPTTGTIRMVGTNVFVPTTGDVAKSIYDAIMNREASIVVGDIEWSLAENTPANGLPYREDFELPSQEHVIHTVDVAWTIEGVTTVTSEVSNTTGGRRRRSTRGRTASKLRYKRRTGRTRRR